MLSSIAKEMNARKSGVDHSPFGIFYSDLPPVSHPDRATIILKSDLARRTAGEIVSAQQAREQGLVI